MKTILDKINKADEIQAKKTELGKHEVELALIDDFKKLLNEANNDFKSFNDDYRKFNDFKKLVINSGGQLEVSLRKLDASYSTIVKQAQELGLKFSTTKEGQDYLNLVAMADPKIIKSLVDKAQSI
jgi:ribosomal protein L20